MSDSRHGAIVAGQVMTTWRPDAVTHYGTQANARRVVIRIYHHARQAPWT